MKSFHLSIAVAVLTVQFHAVFADHPRRLQGWFSCDFDRDEFPWAGPDIYEDQKIRYATVDVVKTGDGDNIVQSFTIDSSGDFDIYLPDAVDTFSLILKYEHESNEYGNVYLWHRSATITREVVTDVATLSLDGDDDTAEILVDTNTGCLVFKSMMYAVVDYKDRVGEPVDIDFKASFPALGGFSTTPYLLYDLVMVPPEYTRQFDPLVAKHDLAHAIRHKVDGSLSHFLWDAFRFSYHRVHYCNSSFNSGFAFNEGWANYWSDVCIGGDPYDSHKVEENVAAALHLLQTECGLTDAEMWQVLEEYPGRVHYFWSFESKAKAMYGCSFSVNSDLSLEDAPSFGASGSGKEEEPKEEKEEEKEPEDVENMEGMDEFVYKEAIDEIGKEGGF